MQNQKLVLGIFSERDNAEDAIKRLEKTGYNPKDFSIVMKDQKEAKEMAESTGVGDAAAGAASGATTGAIIGGIAGLVASIAIPGLGAFFIGGPIAAALGLTGAAASTVSGATTGAVAGGLLGALTGFGLSDDEAKEYEKSIKEGGILMVVPARSGEEQEVSELMKECGADQIKTVQHQMETSNRSSRRDSEEFAHMGAKGGESAKSDDEGSESNPGKGWHNEPEHHAEAAQGKKPHNS